MAGTVYNIPPIPPDPNNTTHVDAGVLRFGVEYRLLDEAELAANYEGTAMEQIQAAIDGKTIEDSGVSIHVVARDGGHEYLRFDCFENEPHYHYIDAGGERQTIVEYDRVALGDMIAWTMSQLRTRLNPMLEHAGGGRVVCELEPARIDEALIEVERLARAADAALTAQRTRGGPG